MGSEGPESERCGPSGAWWVTPGEKRPSRSYETVRSKRNCSASRAFAPFCGSLSALYWSYRAYPSSIPGTRKQQEDEKEACIREEKRHAEEKMGNV